MMPSASNNNINNKLEKQASITGSVHSGSGGGPGGPLISSGQNITESSATNNINENSNTKEKSAAAVVAGGVTTVAGAVAAAAAAANDASNPMKQSIITIEHKIRNLEKRKTKLESYRAIQATGKELSSDQKAAVAKYEAVIATLEFARDFSKQMLQFTKDAEKEQKKQARKELIQKAQTETVKIREVLIIQNILSCFTDEAVRSDFLTGDNGAVKLESADLESLEKFCMDIQTRRPETSDDIAFITAAQKAAEYFSMTIDGRPKQYGETTFENLRRVFNQIQESGYLDKIYLAQQEPMSEPIDEDFSATGGEGDENATGEDTSLEENLQEVETANEGSQNIIIAGGEGNGMMQAPLQQQQMEQPQPQNEQQMEMQQHQQQQVNAPMPPQAMQAVSQPTAVAAVPPNFQTQPTPSSAGTNTTPVHVAAMYPVQLPPQQQQQQAPPPSQMQQVINVQQVPPQPQQMVGPPQPQAPQQQRQLIANSSAAQIPQGAPMPLPPGHFSATTVRAVEQSFFKQHQQYMQQMHPLAEVISGGSFYFLQDSELDSPEMAAAAGKPVPVQVSGVVFEQQAPHQQQMHLQHHQQQQPNHVEMVTATDMHKTVEQQQLLANSMQQQQQAQQQPQQPIPTQTFTNQSFPPIPQAQQQQQQQPQPPPATAVIVNNSNNTLTMVSNTPSPMFQPNNQQLFSPVAQQQLLLQQEINEQQQSHMMIMARLKAQQQQQPQPRQQQQQQQSQQLPPALVMQQSEVVVTPTNVSFPIENPVVPTVTYEQQLQQQMTAVELKSNVMDEKKTPDEAEDEWEATLKRASHAASSKPSVIETNKWSTEMNSVGTPPTPAGTNTPTARKLVGDWSTTASGGGGGGASGSYDDANQQSTTATHETNHWNSNQHSETGGYGRGGRGPSSYQRRGDDRRGDRDDRRGDRPSGGNSGYRGRSNNYGSGSSQQQNGGSGGGTRGGSGNTGGGIYFRNNDSNGGGSGSGGGGGSSYYQNGGGSTVYSSGKDTGSRYESGGGGGNYRGPRGGGGNSTRGNAPPPRNIGRNGAGGGNGVGGGTTNASSSYMNPRQSNRMPMGLENKN